MEVPYGNGLVAAFVFLIFELLVFPVLLDSTSKVASLFLDARARRGKQLRVESLRFSLWNEGLVNGHKSHLFLLLVRITCVAIPVYLETRLESRKVPIRVSRKIEHAFVVAPQDDWITYQDRSSDPIIILRENAELAYDRCVRIDRDSWVSAKVANVTYSANRYVHSLECVNGTARRLFRDFPELPPHVNPSKGSGIPARYDKNVSLSMTWIQGPLYAFPPSPARARLETDGDDDAKKRIIFRMEELKVRNLNGIECFAPKELREISISGEPNLNFICQNATDNNVDFYTAAPLKGSVGKGALEIGSDSRTNDTKLITQIRNVDLFFVGRLQFANDMVLNGSHIANVDFITQFPLAIQDFRGVLRRVLYSKASNISVSIPGGEFSESTLLDKTILTVGGLEIFAVLLFGAMVQLYFLRWGKHIQRPNTLNGLSECWALSTGSNDETEARNEKISLGFSRSRFVPAVMNRRVVNGPLESMPHDEEYEFA